MKYVAKTKQTVTAWKYENGVGVPMWVARKCHDLGNGKLTANTIVGPRPIEFGDYVVLIDEDMGTVAVVSATDFESGFEPAATLAGKAGVV